MCSFGMGVERTVCAFLEIQLHKLTQPTWSWSLAPFKVLVLGEREATLHTYRKLIDLGFDAMLDDREPGMVSFGSSCGKDS